MTRSSLRCPQIVGLVKQRKSKFLLVELLLLGFIVGVTVWGYYDILDDFFIMDDFDMIRGHSTFHKFLEHWSVPVGGGMYRPLIDLLFIWDFYWWEWNPLGWHLSNLLFHLVNSLLVYALAKHLTHSVYTGVVAGGLFGLHTCHTEAVTWISARMDVVCTTFFLLSVWLFVHQVPGTPAVKTPKWRSFLSVACFTCALLVKEMAVMLPFVLIAHDVIFSADGKPNARALWKQARVYLPYFGVLALYFTIRLTVLDGIGGHVPDWFGFFILENLVWYFKFLAIPFTEMVFSASLFVNVAGIVVVVAVSLLVSKNSRFLILWVLLTLAPVYMLNIGRGVYLASVGFCILFALLLTFTVKARAWISHHTYLHTALRLVQFVLIVVVFYHYGTAIHISNAWWSKVAAINEQVPLEVKALYPALPQGAMVCLQNVPLVPNQRFHHAFSFRYLSANIGGVYVQEFEECAQDARPDEIVQRYFFLYYRHNSVHDMTSEIRERLISDQAIRIQKIPRRPAFKLSKASPRLEIPLDAKRPCASIGFVTSLANGITVPQGTVVAQGRIEGVEGTVATVDFAAGRDTAEWAVRFPQIQNKLQHTSPQNVYRAWTIQHSRERIVAAQNYIKRVPFRSRVFPQHFTLELRASDEVPDDLILDLDRIIFYSVPLHEELVAK